LISKVVIASNNPGKLREFAQLLEPLGIEALPQSAFSIPEADEPHQTFIENALAKARHASRISGLPALADDSGICVPALEGAPGVFSARFAGEPKSDERNNQRLLAALRNHADRSAYYYCVLVLVRSPDDPRPLVADGSWHGHVVMEPRGKGGFGYDPYFYLPDFKCTAAELEGAQKNRISHRGQALAALIAKVRVEQEEGR
jgi:XTP/dITP diphosphohydrolase